MQLFNLHQFLIDFQLKQGQMAKILNCSQSLVSHIGNQLRGITVAQQNVLKQNFGDISKYLLENTERRKNKKEIEVNTLLKIIEEKDKQINKLLEILSKSQFTT